MALKEIVIDGRPLGPARDTYVVAEISANHLGKIDKAFDLITAAKDAGADAVKLQTYVPDSMTIDCDAPSFMIGGGTSWDGMKLYDLYKEAMTPLEWHADLFAHARKQGITIFSSPFDRASVDLLADLGAPAYKIASFELVDLELISYVGKQGKPVIMSCGMANLSEIEAAVKTVRESGCDDLVLLHCVSAYPSQAKDANLATIPHLSQSFDVLTGLSDHTLGSAVATAAVALGAVFVEKHMTMDRAEGGPDAAFSMEPAEFADLVDNIRDGRAAVGHVNYGGTDIEEKMRPYRRSIYVVKDIEIGECFTEENIRIIRPGDGLQPSYYRKILGKKAARALKRGTPMRFDAAFPE